MIEGHKFHDIRELEYVLARIKLDQLCDSIVRQQVTLQQAKEEYARIEENFLSSNKEEADLFRMIYKSRIERLCGQFLTGDADGA